MSDQLEPDSSPPSFHTWQFYVGITLLILSIICPLFIFLVASLNISNESKLLLSALLALGIPELLLVIAVILIGKPGYHWIKEKCYHLFKRYTYSHQVSPTRYYIGLILFMLPLTYYWLISFVSGYIPNYENYRFYLNFISSVFFILSFIILGEDFWDKLRSLFVYKSKAVFENDSEGN